MAKVTGGLMSMEASGKFADSIVFDKRGYARGYSTPTNPKTENQGNVRQVLLAAQNAIGVIGDTTKTAVQRSAPVGYRWNSFLVQSVIGTNSADWDASNAAFQALDATAQGAWNTQATNREIPDSHLDYASDPAITGGAALFALARALRALGLNTVAGTPGAANAAAWATFITA